MRFYLKTKEIYLAQKQIFCFILKEREKKNFSKLKRFVSAVRA